MARRSPWTLSLLGLFIRFKLIAEFLRKAPVVFCLLYINRYFLPYPRPTEFIWALIGKEHVFSVCPFPSVNIIVDNKIRLNINWISQVIQNRLTLLRVGFKLRIVNGLQHANSEKRLLQGHTSRFFKIKVLLCHRCKHTFRDLPL